MFCRVARLQNEVCTKDLFFELRNSVTKSAPKLSPKLLSLSLVDPKRSRQISLQKNQEKITDELLQARRAIFFTKILGFEGRGSQMSPKHRSSKWHYRQRDLGTGNGGGKQGRGNKPPIDDAPRKSRRLYHYTKVLPNRTLLFSN